MPRRIPYRILERQVDGRPSQAFGVAYVERGTIWLFVPHWRTQTVLEALTLEELCEGHLPPPVTIYAWSDLELFERSPSHLIELFRDARYKARRRNQIYVETASITRLVTSIAVPLDEEAMLISELGSRSRKGDGDDQYVQNVADRIENAVRRIDLPLDPHINLEGNQVYGKDALGHVENVSEKQHFGINVSGRERLETRFIEARSDLGLLSDGIPDIEWCEVPPGYVKFDGQRRTPEIAPFQIAKYPITVAQYRAFLDAPDGYACAEWWQGLRRHPDGPSSQPWSAEDLPAVCVSWFDAVACCRWLTARLEIGRASSPARVIRLPTEWEWQRAATGGIPSNMVPWGERWEPGRANTLEAGYGRTTPVWKHPRGVSPVGALDMAGNVWEWCLNGDDDLAGTDVRQLRPLRGGSWRSKHAMAHSAFRAFGRPERRTLVRGFRVVQAVPIP